MNFREDREIEYEGIITFDDALTIYRRIISVGSRKLNIFGLDAFNYTNGAILTTDMHYDENDFTVTITGNPLEMDIVASTTKEIERFEQYLISSASPDPLIADSPNVRYRHETARYDTADVQDMPVDSVNTWRQPRSIEFGSHSYRWPLSKHREIRIRGESGFYTVTLISDSVRELGKMERQFYRVMSKT